MIEWVDVKGFALARFLVFWRVGFDSRRPDGYTSCLR
jgi:hypothetical protein